MNLIKFVKDAGETLARAVGLGGPDADDIAKVIAKAGLTIENLKIEIDHKADRAVVSGMADTIAEKEKTILIVGNTKGIAEVEDRLTLPPPPPSTTATPTSLPTAKPSTFHTVEKGDTLWEIAQKAYGKGSLYPLIFEANTPMLKHPDRIYPGQVLRIPPLDA
jgi:nucleoid-associated protein YgaU